MSIFDEFDDYSYISDGDSASFTRFLVSTPLCFARRFELIRATRPLTSITMVHGTLNIKLALQSRLPKTLGILK